MRSIPHVSRLLRGSRPWFVVVVAALAAGFILARFGKETAHA
jgi:hypothetical protein